MPVDPMVSPVALECNSPAIRSSNRPQVLRGGLDSGPAAGTQAEFLLEDDSMFVGPKRPPFEDACYDGLLCARSETLESPSRGTWILGGRLPKVLTPEERALLVDRICGPVSIPR